MNYASAVLAFVIAFSVGHWFLRGRKFYVGPRSHARIVNGEAVVDETPPGGEEKNIAASASIIASGNSHAPLMVPG